MRIGVLALQGDVAEHRRALAAAGAEVVPVRLPRDLVGVDGIVLPGGESTTMSMLLQSSGLFDPLARALQCGLPAFGTCAGLILLADRVLDGRPDQRSFGVLPVAVRRNGYGRQLQSFECDLEVADIAGGSLRAVFIRAPRIESVGPDVDVLARLPSGDGRDGVAGAAAGGGTPVLCRQGQVLVAAFHPELTGDGRVHQRFVAMVAGGEPAGVAAVPAGTAR